jgi:hypothetical protein
MCAANGKIACLAPVPRRSRARRDTASFVACAGHVEIMQLVISSKGCSKDAVTSQGNSALHLAALNAREPACKLLVKCILRPEPCAPRASA